MTIKDFRIMCGLSQKELSEAYEIPIRTVQDWEAGRRKPPEYLVKLLFFKMAFDHPVLQAPFVTWLHTEEN